MNESGRNSIGMKDNKIAVQPPKTGGVDTGRVNATLDGKSVSQSTVVTGGPVIPVRKDRIDITSSDVGGDASVKLNIPGDDPVSDDPGHGASHQRDANPLRESGGPPTPPPPDAPHIGQPEESPKPKGVVEQLREYWRSTPNTDPEQRHSVSTKLHTGVQGLIEKYRPFVDTFTNPDGTQTDQEVMLVRREQDRDKIVEIGFKPEVQTDANGEQKVALKMLIRPNLKEGGSFPPVTYIELDDGIVRRVPEAVQGWKREDLPRDGTVSEQEQRAFVDAQAMDADIVNMDNAMGNIPEVGLPELDLVLEQAVRSDVRLLALHVKNLDKLHEGRAIADQAKPDGEAISRELSMHAASYFDRDVQDFLDRHGMGSDGPPVEWDRQRIDWEHDGDDSAVFHYEVGNDIQGTEHTPYVVIKLEETSSTGQKTDTMLRYTIVDGELRSIKTVQVGDYKPVVSVARAEFRERGAVRDHIEDRRTDAGPLYEVK